MTAVRNIRSIIRRVALLTVVVLVIIPTVFFFYWMFLLSFRTNVDNMAYPPKFLTRTVVVDNYSIVFKQNPFFRYLLNSLIVAAASTLLGLLVGLPAAYSIARYKQKGVALAIMLARMTPHISYLLPWFIFFRMMRLLDSYISLVVTHLLVSLPIIVWTLISYFEDLPRDIEDSAFIDGCSIYGVFARIALPLVKPGIIVVSILSFIFSWNNFMFSVVLSGPRTRTLPVAVYSLMTFEEIIWGQLAAAAAVITLPVIVLTLIIQKHIVSGLTFGAIKG